MNLETLLFCFNFQLLLEYVSFLMKSLVLKEKLNKVFHVMFHVIATALESFCVLFQCDYFHSAGIFAAMIQKSICTYP